MISILKKLILLIIFLSAGFSLFLNYYGYFDPVSLAIELSGKGERDNALDIIDYSIENRIGDQRKLLRLKKEYDYSAEEKGKDFFYNGVVKGEVYNLWSGLGCVGADLLVVGDVRDLAKEGYHLITGQEVDKVVATLSAAGVATTVAEGTGIGLTLDAGVSLVKTLVKYVHTTAKIVPDSLLKTLVSAKKMMPEIYIKLWKLYKEGGFSIQSATTILKKIKDVKYLDAAVDIVQKLGKGGFVFIQKTGEHGLELYAKHGGLVVDMFKRNPYGVIGLSKFNALVHGTKIFYKNGPLIPLLVLVTTIALLLGLIPVWGVVIVMGFSFLALIGKLPRFKLKSVSASLDDKSGFYPKVKETFLSYGYSYFAEDDMKGKGRQHRSRPDFIAEKENVIVVGEIKSPKENPCSTSWRSHQKSDTDGFRKVREEVRGKEKDGLISKEIGGHEIIIRGQIVDYFRKIGKTYDLPVQTSAITVFWGAYAFPEGQKENVLSAVQGIGMEEFDIVEIPNGACTVLFSLKELL